MTTNYLTNSFQEQVTQILRGAVQQEGSVLNNTVTTGSYSGSAAQVADFVKAAARPKKNVAAKSDTTYTDIDTTRRWVVGDTYRDAILVDQLQKLETLNDPTGMYSKMLINSMGRERDEVINASFFAAAKTGQTGSGTTPFASGNTVAVGTGAAADTGMNFQKITTALKKLKANQVDVNREELYMPVTAKIWDDMINDPEINNKLYGGLLNYQTGEMAKIMGINIVHYEDLDVDANSDIRVPLYTKSAIQLGIWKDTSVIITPNVATKNNAAQIYIDQFIGATRLEEEKIIEIICDPS